MPLTRNSSFAALTSLEIFRFSSRNFSNRVLLISIHTVYETYVVGKCHDAGESVHFPKRSILFSRVRSSSRRACRSYFSSRDSSSCPSPGTRTVLRVLSAIFFAPCDDAGHGVWLPKVECRMTAVAIPLVAAVVDHSLR
jgi:hypothetical protein